MPCDGLSCVLSRAVVGYMVKVCHFLPCNTMGCSELRHAKLCGSKCFCECGGPMWCLVQKRKNLFALQDTATSSTSCTPVLPRRYNSSKLF